MNIHHLISEAIIAERLIKAFTLRGKTYETIFKYNGEPSKLGSRLVVGFRQGETEYTAEAVIPAILDNGTVIRNNSIWYPVLLALPPMKYVTEKEAKVRYLQSIISDNMFASSLDDFLPEVAAVAPATLSVLGSRLMNEEPALADDTRNWIIINIADAILETFNTKIANDITRSARDGFAGVSATPRAIHTLMQAYVQYLENVEAASVMDEKRVNEYEEVELLGDIRHEDHKNIVVLHPLAKELNLKENTPFDFCTCSQDSAIVSARIKDGISIVDNHLVGTPTFAYAKYRRAVVGITFDNPRRTIVSRAIYQSMKIEQPMDPLVTTEIEVGVDSLSMPGVRMSHGLNYQDAIIISKTMATALGAFKVVTDKIVVPEANTIEFLKVPWSETGNTDIVALKAAAKELVMKPRLVMNYMVNRGELIATIAGQTVANEPEDLSPVRAKVSRRSVLYKITKSDFATDTGEKASHYTITYLSYYPLEVGDKISDAHGNKATVSIVLDDEDMPIWNGTTRAHYIATPYIMKRLPIGAEIEDRLALYAVKLAEAENREVEPIQIESGACPTLPEVTDMLVELCGADPYRASVEFRGKVHEDVPVCYRRMFRLDHTAVDALKVKSGVILDDFGRVSANAKTGPEIATFVARGANRLALYMLQESGVSHILANEILPLFYSVEGSLPVGETPIVIDTRLPRELLGNPVSGATFAKYDFNGTAADPRLKTQYGVIKYRKGNIIVPPHDPISRVDGGKGSLFMINHMSVEANRVLSEIISESKAGEDRARVRDILARYKNFLARRLCGKEGLMRNALFPVFPYSLRAVASSHLSDDVFTIMVPEHSFRQLCTTNRDIERIYADHDMVILKRDPVHQNQNVIGVHFKTWKNSTIGVHPALIEMLDGDFDGDELTVSFVSDDNAYSDIAKLTVDMVRCFKGSKQIKDASFETATMLLRQNVGFSSTFMHPHETDTCAMPDLAVKLIAGTLSMDELQRECISAARDFEQIKDGTAFVGALSLLFIYTRDINDKESLNGAMNLYHYMAQNTLDSKAGRVPVSREVVNAFYAGNEEKIRTSLSTLGFSNARTEEELISFMKNVKAYASMREYLNIHHPVLQLTQRSSRSGNSLSDCDHVVTRLKKNVLMGEGMWDMIFDYSLMRTDQLPFAEKNPFVVEKEEEKIMKA